MTELKFTPGPWQMGHSHSVENSDHEKVATCVNINLGSGKCFANARLISAAPDLYDALVKAREFIDPTWAPMTAEMIDDALRKARGDDD